MPIIKKNNATSHQETKHSTKVFPMPYCRYLLNIAFANFADFHDYLKTNMHLLFVDIKICIKNPVIIIPTALIQDAIKKKGLNGNIARSPKAIM